MQVWTKFAQSLRALMVFPMLLIIIVTITSAQTTSAPPNAPEAQAISSPSWKPFDVTQYRHLRSHFPNPISPYSAREIAPLDMANSPRIDQLLHDGKLYISINDAVALALENNLDIAVFRYNLNIADTDIWKALAGSSISGVNTGIVQNTPAGPVGFASGGEAGSGGVGTTQVGPGQGGTSGGAGGAGSGLNGLVTSTFGSGPQTSSYDPVITGALRMQHLTLACNTALCGSNDNTTGADFTYSQAFHWGTEMGVTFNNTRLASNSIDNLRNPALASSFQFNLTQHLLQGFGRDVNTRFIQIAKNNRELTDVAFRLQVTTTVDLIENMYWNLVYAYESVKVQQQQLSFAQQTLDNNKAQVEIGSLAQIEVVRAQSAVATAQQGLTSALTNLERAQLLLKNAISRSLVDPVLADAEVIPISTLEIPAQEPVIPIQDLVREAFQHRPDVEEAHINLSNSDLSKKAVRNSLLPSLDVSAFYGGSGLGGNQNILSICFTTPQACGLRTPPIAATPISYGDTLSQLVNSTAPNKGVALTLNIPLRNRAAQATQVRSELEYRQAQLQIQQLENQVRIEVRNAQFDVQQNRASVFAAQAAVDLARQTLEIEQKKYKIGASTQIMVLQDQTALAQAQATLLAGHAAYNRAEVELDRATGLLLEHAGIGIADAERGQVSHGVNIPRVSAGPAYPDAGTNPQPH
ncbi:MAG TPA: TolC family protein [Candidatus Sulfotelmatobacter sp.]|nr:TolC family protein [Candidatus Sulfotelmatobacter sp.]